MPEGDTVHKLAAFLAPRLTGRRIESGYARAGTEVDLAGRRIEAVQARGKHLLMALDDGRILRSHLGMWGSWHHYAPGEAWRKPARRAAVVLTVDARVYVCFNPKEVELLRAAGVRRRLLASRLGPDLLSPSPDLAKVVARAREMIEPEAPLVDVLLDQRLAAGIGNVYKSEVLFLQGLPPLRPLSALDDATLAGTYRCARRLLLANLGAGPRVTRRGGGLWVYGRAGRPCHACGASIAHALLGRDQRPTCWCPSCQSGDGPGPRIDPGEIAGTERSAGARVEKQEITTG